MVAFQNKTGKFESYKEKLGSLPEFVLLLHVIKIVKHGRDARGLSRTNRAKEKNTFVIFSRERVTPDDNLVDLLIGREALNPLHLRNNQLDFSNTTELKIFY